MSSLYSLTLSEEGYQFTTDLGITYFLYFTDFFLRSDTEEEIIVQSFGFRTEPEIAIGDGILNKYDEKVKMTILSCLSQYFVKNPDVALLYICDNKDGYARHRQITFGKWYKGIDTQIEKFGCMEYHAKAGFYTAILIRSDNLLKQFYVDAFYTTLKEYFPETIPR